jgi:hypothetical protein
MDTGPGQEKLIELYVEDRIVKANDRRIERFEIDPAAEKRLLWKLDLRVVPVLWFLFVSISMATTSNSLRHLLTRLSFVLDACVP